MKCDGLKAFNMPRYAGEFTIHEVYLKSDVDAAIDELKTENESLLQQNRELCLALQVMYSKEEYDKQKAEHHKERHEYIKMIAELKAENERLNNALDKEHGETIKYMDELCNAKNEIERLTIDKRNAELRADVADATVEKLKDKNAVLKQNLEDAKATAYAESVDAGMRERRRKRALWLARSYRGRDNSILLPSKFMRNVWDNVERKCLAKAEQYK